MNLNGTIKKTQALSGRLLKSSGGGGSVQEIYWVHYGVGTATNAEVNEAIAANKLPICYWDSTDAYGRPRRTLYFLIRNTPTESFFSGVDYINNTIIVRRLYADAWDTQTIRYEGKLTWDTTPRLGSVNPVTSGGIYNAIQNATVSDERIAEAVDDWMDANVPSIGTLSYAAKQALLNCFAHVAWIDDQGQSYYNALESELFPDTALESITAVFTPEQAAPVTIDPTRVSAYISTDGKWTASSDSYSVCVPVTSGKRYALTWSTTDSSSVGTIFRYGFSDTNTASGQTLSGWIRSTPQDSQNTQVIASGAYLVLQFGVSVAPSIVSNNYFTLTELATPIYDTDSLDTLRQYLTVTATYSDSTTATVTDYTLSGTLTAGTSTITVGYGGKTDTFNVAVTEFGGKLGYIDTGLAMLLDGIANGENGAHNTTVSTLYDQSGNNKNWVIDAGTVTATDTALVFSDSCFKPQYSWSLSTPNTIEVVCELNNVSLNSYQCISCALASGGDSGTTKLGSIGTHSGKILHYTGGAYGCLPLSSGMHTYTFVNENGTWKGYVDGNETSFLSETTTWRTSTARLGAFRNAGNTANQYFFAGKLYSFRYYTTSLTSAEVSRNRENDVNRFSA